MTLPRWKDVPVDEVKPLEIQSWVKKLEKDKRLLPATVSARHQLLRRTGARAIYGAIRSKWASLGWERGRLGYPITSEYAVADGRRNDFQHGSITRVVTTGGRCGSCTASG